MKKTAIFLIICISLIGCSSVTPKRVFNGNVFTSDSPKFELKLDPSFIYLQDINNDRTSQSVNRPEVILNSDTNAYIFIEPDGDKVKRGVAILFSKTNGVWANDPYQDIKYAIEKGNCEITGKKFKYYTEAILRGGGYLADHIIQKGYKLSPGLLRVNGRIPMGNQKLLIELIYFETFGDEYDRNSMTVWADAHNGGMTAKERKFLDDFNNNGISAFDVLASY